jgi:hypothetical protein
MAEYYRIAFDPRNPEDNFKNRDDFLYWCKKHLNGINWSIVGLMVPNWADVKTCGGARLWAVKISLTDVLAPAYPDPMHFFADNKWAIDGFDMLIYIKPSDGGNEYLFPIHKGGNPDA